MSPTPTQIQFGERLKSRKPPHKVEQAVKHLNLEAKQLVKFPLIVGDSVGSLVKIDLRNNQITRLPRKEVLLSKLKALRMDHNSLSELPDWLGKLPALEYLSASHNFISLIPAEFPKTLAVLELSSNKLRTFSPKFAKSVPLLTELRIHQNMIQSLPCTFSLLGSMTLFSLQWFLYLPTGLLFSFTPQKKHHDPEGPLFQDGRGRLFKSFTQLLRRMKENEKKQYCHFYDFVAHFTRYDASKLNTHRYFAKNRSLLHYAAAKGHQAIAENILEMAPGGDVLLNSLDIERTTPLGVALKYRQYDIALYLLSRRDLNTSIPSRRYGYPLHQALQVRNFEIALKIAHIDSKANNAPDNDGNTSLHLLFQRFNSDPVRAWKLASYLVLQQGCSLNLTNKHTLTPLLLAVKRSQTMAVLFTHQYNQLIQSSKTLPSPSFSDQLNERPVFSRLTVFSKVGQESGCLTLTEPEQKSEEEQIIYFEFESNLGVRERFDYDAQGGRRYWSVFHFCVQHSTLEMLLLLFSNLSESNLFLLDKLLSEAKDLAVYNNIMYKLLCKEQRKVMKSLRDIQLPDFPLSSWRKKRALNHWNVSPIPRPRPKSSKAALCLKFLSQNGLCNKKRVPQSQAIIMRKLTLTSKDQKIFNLLDTNKIKKRAQRPPLPPLSMTALQNSASKCSSSPRMNVTRLKRLSPQELDVSCELPEREPKVPHNLKQYESSRPKITKTVLSAVSAGLTSALNGALASASASSLPPAIPLGSQARIQGNRNVSLFIGSLNVNVNLHVRPFKTPATSFDRIREEPSRLISSSRPSTLTNTRFDHFEDEARVDSSSEVGSQGPILLRSKGSPSILSKAARRTSHLPSIDTIPLEDEDPVPRARVADPTPAKTTATKVSFLSSTINAQKAAKFRRMSGSPIRPTQINDTQVPFYQLPVSQSQSNTQFMPVTLQTQRQFKDALHLYSIHQSRYFNHYQMLTRYYINDKPVPLSRRYQILYSVFQAALNSLDRDAAIMLLYLLKHLPQSDPLRLEAAHLCSLLPPTTHSQARRDLENILILDNYSQQEAQNSERPFEEVLLSDRTEKSKRTPSSQEEQIPFALCRYEAENAVINLARAEKEQQMLRRTMNAWNSPLQISKQKPEVSEEKKGLTVRHMSTYFISD